MSGRIPWPSQRAQWSAFFAVVTILLSGDIQAPASLATRFITVFLIFYFPIAWVYNHDFTLPGRSRSDDG